MMDSSSSPVPVPLLSPIGHTSRKRWKLLQRLSNRSRLASKETSSQSTNRTKSFEEEKKENDDDLSSSTSTSTNSSSSSSSSSSITTSITITLKNTNDADPSDDPSAVLEPPDFTSFSDLPSFQMPPSLTKDQDLDDHRDDSFQTHSSFSESSSEEEEDNHKSMNSCCRNNEETDESTQNTSSSSSFCSKQNNNVRFADELGLPIEHILYYECDRKQREHSELLVLCMCPEQKQFEFLHVGYYRHEDNDNDNDNDEGGDDQREEGATTVTSVQVLLRALPGMCTGSVFVDSTFVALYRNNGVDRVFEKISSSSLAAKQDDNQNANANGNNNNNNNNNSTDDDDDDEEAEECSLSLRDCGFRENELVVAAIHGSSEQAVLEGIGPLLSNDKIMKTLKRARRSRRSLKFIHGIDDDNDDDDDSGDANEGGHSHRRRRQRRPLSLGSTKQKLIVSKGSNENNTVDCGGELVDEYCHDYDPFYDVSEYHKQLSLALLVVCVGTVVFSVIGL